MGYGTNGGMEVRYHGFIGGWSTLFFIFLHLGSLGSRLRPLFIGFLPFLFRAFTSHVPIFATEEASAIFTKLFSFFVRELVKSCGINLHSIFITDFIISSVTIPWSLGGSLVLFKLESCLPMSLAGGDIRINFPAPNCFFEDFRLADFSTYSTLPFFKGDRPVVLAHDTGSEPSRKSILELLEYSGICRWVPHFSHQTVELCDVVIHILSFEFKHRK